MTATRFLDKNGVDLDMALKVYTGNFGEAFRANAKLMNTTLPVVDKQIVSAGHNFQNFEFGDIPEAVDFTPGDEMTGQSFAMDEVVTSSDKYVVAHQLIPQDVMKKSHVNILPKLGMAHGRIIPMKYDRRLFVCAAKAARAGEKTKDGLTIHNGGNIVTKSGGSISSAYPLSTTGAANFRADLRTLAYQMDLDEIPMENRWLWMIPHMRNVLLYDNTAQVFSRDYNGSNDQQGRRIVEIEGFKFVDVVNQRSVGGSMPDSNITDEISAKYNGNFSVQANNGTPVAIALTSGPAGEAAVQMVTFEKVMSRIVYQPEKLAYLVQSFILAGAGQLNDWCAGSIEVVT